MVTVALAVCLQLQSARYEVNGQFVEILGVGRMQEGVFEAWGPTGVPDSALTKMVNAKLSRLKPEQAQISLVPGRKNRCLIVKKVASSPHHPNLLFNSEMGVVDIGRNIRLFFKTVTTVGVTTVEELELMSISVDPSATTANLSLTEWDWVDPSTVQMSAKIGSTCRIGDAEVRLASISMDEGENGLPRWNYRFDVTNGEALGMSIASLDKNGDFIQGRDENGRPKIRRRWNVNPVPQKGDVPGHLRGSFASKGQDLGTYIFHPKDNPVLNYPSEVDPAFVATFSITTTWHRIVKLGAVVLDPH